MKIKITTEYIKLDQLLKFSGLCMTGGEATAAIKEGFVTYNGEICTQRGKKVRVGDIVTLEDEIIEVE